MKNALLFLMLLSFLNCDEKWDCKRPTAPSENQTTAHKIASNNGIKNWEKVSEIKYTFNVDRNGNHFERSWIWQPKTDRVTLFSEKDTVAYHRFEMDSLARKTDEAFINDKYWLFAPFNLVWDKGTSFAEKQNAVAPISKDTLNQLTIMYGNEGGYTPGDAYDFYHDDDFMIREWTYRQANDSLPTMSTTWEDYENFNGIVISKMHRDGNGNFKLYFTNISVK